MARQLSIIIALQFGGGLQPLVKLFLVLLPIFVYTVAVFALRPFASSEQDFVECSTQGLLIFAGFGGLLRTENHNGTTTDLGTAVVYGTLIFAVLLIVWALIRDVAYFFGSKQVLQNLNKGETKMPLLGPFDKGLNGIMLFHFAEHASSRGLTVYMKLRASVLSSKTLLGRKGFWEGLHSLEKKRDNVHSEAISEGNSETEKVTSAEFNTTLRFIQSGGALRILRVLSKLCDEPTYIKFSNWLVFKARSSECMQLCYLILSMLTAHPKFAGIVDHKCEGPDNTAATGSKTRAHHTREERPGRHHMMEIGQLSGELGPKSSLSNFCRQYSTLASHTLPLSSSLREATKFVATKEAAVAKSSSFGLLALQDKLSFRHWSMIDATPAEIKLLVADVVTYKRNVAACMIARFWRRYVFQTRAETLIGTSTSTTKPVKVKNAQVERQLTQHGHLTSMCAPSHVDEPELPVPEGRSSRPMLRNITGGTVDSYGDQTPDYDTKCSSFERKVSWI